MTTLECIDCLNMMTDRSWLLCRSPDPDETILKNVALARLSGLLDGCKNEEDVRAAIEYGHSLVEAGNITFQELDDDVDAIDDELAVWGQGMDDDLRGMGFDPDMQTSPENN